MSIRPVPYKSLLYQVKSSKAFAFEDHANLNTERFMPRFWDGFTLQQRS